MHAVLLAGGFGTRLRSHIADVPKPLAPIAGKPFIAWLIHSLIQQGVTAITLSLHHEWQKIQDYFNANPLSITLNYAVEDEALGTGGAMAYALQQYPTREPTLVLNGDSYMQVNIAELYSQHTKTNAQITLVTREVADTGRYGKITEKSGILTDFTQGKIGEPGLINTGIYVLDPQLFLANPMQKAFSFEHDFLPMYLSQNPIHSFKVEGYFIDIGLPEDYERARKELPDVRLKHPNL
jgi:D-glycero-alpha-D-manno-heptose 1-phosphate guanylyltransferase